MRALHWLPPLAWMAVVLGLSAEAASAEQTSRVLLPLLRWLLPGAPPEPLAPLHGLLRKAGHAAAYASPAPPRFRSARPAPRSPAVGGSRGRVPDPPPPRVPPLPPRPRPRAARERVARARGEPR